MPHACHQSPITRPGYRAGERPLNYGLSLPAEPLTRADIDALLAVCWTLRTRASALRARALIVVLWRSGLRIAEALALLPRDVDLDAGTIRVRRGKGGKPRVVGLDAEAGAVLAEWLDCRRALGLRPHHAVFAVHSATKGGKFGKPIYSGYARDLLKKLAKRAGIDRRVHPHGLRHTHAYELSQEAVPLDVIRLQLGHTDIRTTARYIDHLNPRQVVEAIRLRRWDGQRAVTNADVDDVVGRLEELLKHSAPGPATAR